MTIRYVQHITDPENRGRSFLTICTVSVCVCHNLLQTQYLNTHEYKPTFYCIVVGSRRLMPRMHCSRRLVVQTLVFGRSYLHRQVSPPETLVVKGGTTWARNGRWIFPENARLPRNIQGFLHAVNLLHGTNGFTSLLKEDVMRIFSPWKIRRLRAGLKPRTWVPKAGTLPLDHRSNYNYNIISNKFFPAFSKTTKKLHDI